MLIEKANLYLCNTYSKHMIVLFSVSLDLLAADIRLLAKGMKDATGELVNNKKNEGLKQFCLEAEPKVTKLLEDLETAKVM